MLSTRASKNLKEFARPWRFAPTPTYHADEHPEGLISFGLAENSPMREDIANYINEKVVFTTDSVSYRPSATVNARLPEVAAAHLNRILHPYAPIQADQIVIADSPTSLGNILGFNLAEPDEAILVSRPMYGRFELDYGVEAGLQIFYADTSIDGAFASDVVEKYEKALIESQNRGITIRAVLIVNPHNPVGRCYPAETLKEIAKFCDKHDLHLISDEVYASCVFETGDPDAVPFTSILSLNLTNLIKPNLVHVLYGFSKDFASGGLHLGFLVTQNDELQIACKMVLRLHSPSQTAVTIGIAILEDEEFVKSFTEKSRKSLAERYKLVTTALTSKGIQYAKHGNAGFFIYVDLSPFLPDEGPSIRDREFALAERFFSAGVFLHPGEEHGKDPGWFRLVFSQERKTLEEGLRRFLGVLDSIKRS